MIAQSHMRSTRRSKRGPCLLTKTQENAHFY